jgi:hypothetical protein
MSSPRSFMDRGELIRSVERLEPVELAPAKV